MWNEQPCDAGRPVEEDARILIVAMDDIAARLEALVQHLRRVRVVSTFDNLRELLEVQTPWCVILVAGDPPNPSSMPSAARLSSNLSASVVCTISADQAQSPWVIRLVESMLLLGLSNTRPSEQGTVAGLGQLTLDERNRTLCGLPMESLSVGELRLLQFLSRQPQRWYSTRELSLRVYQRADAAGRMLVWKYASTLKKKVVAIPFPVIETCRRRGYRCLATIAEASAADGAPTNAVTD
jgi:hypothetical protein